MSVIDQMVLGNWPTVDDPQYDTQLTVMGESVGGVINIPGLPPELIEAGDGLLTLYRIIEIIEALSIEGSTIPFLNVILVLIDIVLLVIGAFAGRPREEATLNCAHNLLSSKNQAAQLAGIQILRMFQQWDVVISESGPGEVLVAGVVGQLVNNLTGQGIPLANARQIVLYQFQQGADTYPRLAPFLQNGVAAGTPITGPQGFERIFQNIVDQLVAKGVPLIKAQQRAWQDLFKYAPLRWIKAIYIGHQPNDPPPGSCPVGQHWDFTVNDGAGGCVPNKAKPPGPPPPPPPIPTQGDSDGDEITDTLCRQLGQNTEALLQGLTELGATIAGAGDTATCCANITAAIGAVVTSLNAISSSLATLTGAPSAPPSITFAPAITIDVPPAPPATVTINESPSDLTGVVDQLKRRNDDLQAPDAWKNALIESGAIPPEWVQLIQGTTWEEIEASAAHFLGWVLGVGLADATAIVERIFSVVLKPVAGAIWKTLTDIVAGFNLGDGTAVQDIANAAKQVVAGLDKAITTIFGGAANLVLEGYEAGISGIDTTTEAGVSQVVQILLGRAFELGAGAHLLATLPELAYFTKNLGLNATAALLAELAGFHEVMIQVHRPFMSAAIGRPASYSFNRKFSSALPGIGPALTLFARRKMLQVDAQHLADSSGYNRTWQQALFAGAYRPLSARALATLIQDTPFNRAQMQEILEDNAFSPDHVQVMLDLLEYNSTKNVRNSLITQAETAYKAGVISDDEMHQIVTDAGWSDQAWQLVNSKILIERRMTLASEVEKQVIPLIANGNITADQGLQQLEAAGVQDWYAQLVVTLATTKAEIHQAKLEASAEAKLERQRQSNLTRAAVAEFQRGALDQAGLALTLAAIPLDPTIIASIVSVQDATRAGKLRFVFGQFLTPEDARVLDDRVAALEGQFKKQLITLDSARAQLNSLNLPVDQVAALLARWAAALVATGKNAYLLSPLTGLPPT